MKCTLISISLLLLSCNQNNSSNNHNNNKNCNIEAAKQSVLNLKEVQQKEKQISTLIGKDRVTYHTDSVLIKEKSFYEIQMRCNFPYKSQNIITFLVEKNHCENIFLERVDTLLPYSIYQKEQEANKPNKAHFANFFQQFKDDKLFQLQHSDSSVMLFSKEKDNTLIATEHPDFERYIKPLGAYSFIYYEDCVLCKEKNTNTILVFDRVKNNWSLNSIWQK
ncbi:hypothetical protein SAMN05444369_101135 [Capnocytophaga haemolytica]|uniref:Lipoprotein n=1 Tax=Capnocytophaga haemolytica TaxID=45243 RepID=A0AAX2GVY4_9FLAO|nr:hypothetical protein [Capnocytophaga haemolytica]AMD85236.1 hypothetical protein AXF12_06770 [Capnocytophaga haemolytica]SFN63598.1 hypothetical protein SAMN05444369_101135 [Capnocytophaga haemolytica]SNV03952.1 Uncharacterised protein [Capnocytophaga haemolytica]